MDRPFALAYIRKERLPHEVYNVATLHGQGEIYCIMNSRTHQRYIGQTTCIKIKNNKFVYSGYMDRFRQHVKQAFSSDPEKANGCPKLYEAIRQYGPEQFFVYLLERCPLPQLNDREIALIRKYKSRKQGYNVTKGGQFGPRKKKRRYRKRE